MTKIATHRDGEKDTVTGLSGHEPVKGDACEGCEGHTAACIDDAGLPAPIASPDEDGHGDEGYDKLDEYPHGCFCLFMQR